MADDTAGPQRSDGDGQGKDGQDAQGRTTTSWTTPRPQGREEPGRRQERDRPPEGRTRRPPASEAAELEAKVKEFEDRDKTEQQKKDEEKAEAEQRATAAEAKALRFEVAAAKGVPLSQAHRLQGTTKEELEQDADAFLKDVKPGGGGGGQLDGGAARRRGDAGGHGRMIRAPPATGSTSFPAASAAAVT
jgi:hypothetical protein